MNAKTGRRDVACVLTKDSNFRDDILYFKKQSAKFRKLPQLPYFSLKIQGKITLVPYHNITMS